MFGEISKRIPLATLKAHRRPRKPIRPTATELKAASKMLRLIGTAAPLLAAMTGTRS